MKAGLAWVSYRVPDPEWVQTWLEQQAEKVAKDALGESRRASLASPTDPTSLDLREAAQDYSGLT